MRIRWLGYVLVIGAVALLLSVLYENGHRKDVPLLFSASAMLNSIWQNYQKQYLEPSDYRTLDRSRNNITTSEGQGYTMLRAVWLGDKTTFDEEATWTKNNLQHKNDHLFAWLFGQRADGTYGIITDQGGMTSASDADTDIALALVFGYARWQNPQYLGDARDIMRDIWAKEVIVISGTPYLTADDLEASSTKATVAVNPSYFAPYAYRIFAEVDPTHPWNKLADGSYQLLQASMLSPLDASSTAKLPPDWMLINKKTAAIETPTQSQPSYSGNSTTTPSNFGYDAMRVPFRLALDYQWFNDPRDKQLLDQMRFLSNTWKADGLILETYTHAGAVLPQFTRESPAVYGGTIGYFMVSDPTLAPTVYQNKLLFLLNPNTNTWKELLPYYDDNWAWFGIALYNHLLPNLAASVPANILSTQ
jgi:endo-1,4-beta-D-glucanase Y